MFFSELAESPQDLSSGTAAMLLDRADKESYNEDDSKSEEPSSPPSTPQSASGSNRPPLPPLIPFSPKSSSSLAASAGGQGMIFKTDVHHLKNIGKGNDSVIEMALRSSALNTIWCPFFLLLL